MEHFGVLNYLTYVAGTILIVLLPGPNSLYVLSLSAQQGHRRGWAATLGIFAGDLILMALTALGAVTLLSTYPVLFHAFKFAGAFYLAYIGYQLISGAWQNWRRHKNFTDQEITLKPLSNMEAFKKGLFVGALNPKAILFFFSFFVQFVNPDYSTPAVPFIILAVTLQMISLSNFAALIYAGSKLAKVFKNRHKLSALSGGGVGLGFVGFAVKLALAGAI